MKALKICIEYKFCRFWQIPTFGHGTICHFWNNTTETKKLTAWDFEDILQVTSSLMSVQQTLPKPSVHSLSLREYCLDHMTNLFKVWFLHSACGMHLQNFNYFKAPSNNDKGTW